MKLQQRLTEHLFTLQAKLAVRDIPQGTHVRDIQIFDPKDQTRVVATVKVRPAQHNGMNRNCLVVSRK